jgi:hypothetical protein
MLIKYTNVLIQTDKIFNSFDYRTDLIYSNSDDVNAEEALDQEIRNLLHIKEKINMSEFFKSYEATMDIILKTIEDSGEELLLPVKNMASKLYYRLYDYYEIRQISIVMYIVLSILFSFSPELILLIYNIFVRSETKRELKFLKKLIILNGNIKPVDFSGVLKVLIEKSRYYTGTLKEIEEKNRSNSIDNLNIYIPYIRNSGNIEEKLFFEKLDEANNYDFEQAIKNIENEFRLEKREVGRYIRKRIEQIHIIGLIGLMAIILVLMLYLIIPWMNMYNIRQFTFQ